MRLYMYHDWGNQSKRSFIHVIEHAKFVLNRDSLEEGKESQGQG